MRTLIRKASHARGRVHRRPIAHISNAIVIQCIATHKARSLSAHRTFPHCICRSGTHTNRAAKYIKRLGKAQVHSWRCAEKRPSWEIFWKCRHAS
jgi:hypothetical protein